MIPFSWREELSRKRVYDRLGSSETFKVIGFVGNKIFSDSQESNELFTFLCLSSKGNYVLVKEMHQFPESCWDMSCSDETLYSVDVIDLTQEEADQYRFLLKQTYKDQPFQKPPLIL